MSDVSLSAKKETGVLETNNTPMKIDESKLNEEQKKMLAEFRKRMRARFQ